MDSSSSVKSFTSIQIPYGDKPEALLTGDGGVKMLKEWQDEGYNKLRGVQRRTLIAPTGSGKSLLIKALAAEELARDPKARVVIAVPQKIIGSSFGSESVCLRDGKRVDFEIDSANMLLNGVGCVNAITEWLKAKPGKTIGSRTIVCTQATLNAAHKKIMDGRKSKRSPWEGVSLFLDEAHHSLADGGGSGADTNRLGKLVTHWIEREPGPMLLTTATWIRADEMTIVPESVRGDFTAYVHHMERHLESLGVAGTISMRFVIGPVADGLRFILSEGDKKTILYMPNVNTALSRNGGGKIPTLRSYEELIGNVVSADSWTSTLRHKPAKGNAYDVRILDLVTPENREARVEELRLAIRNGGRQFTPNLVLALGLCKEGFDWPEAARGICIGERRSIPEMLQMLGRFLRGFPGKEEIQFNIVLPYENLGSVSSEKARDFIKMILLSMVVSWQMRLPRLTAKQKLTATPAQIRGVDRVREILGGDVEKTAKLVEALVDGAIRAGDESIDDTQFVLKAGKDAGIEITPEDAPFVTMVLAPPFSGMNKALRCVSDIPLDVEMDETIAGGIRMLAMDIAGVTLGELRKQLGTPNEITATEEEVRKFGKGMTGDEYDASKLKNMPFAATFQRTYGKTYKDVMTGERRRQSGEWASEEEVRAFAEGLTQIKYNASRLKNMPSVSRFQSIYGKTYMELTAGCRRRPAGNWASEEDVRAFGKNLSQREYSARKAKNMPHLRAFDSLYGKTYREVMTGNALGDWASPHEIWLTVQGKKISDYNASRPKNMPGMSAFERIVGAAYGPFRDGPCPAETDEELIAAE